MHCMSAAAVVPQMPRLTATSSALHLGVLQAEGKMVLFLTTDNNLQVASSYFKARRVFAWLLSSPPSSLLQQQVLPASSWFMRAHRAGFCWAVC